MLVLVLNVLISSPRIDAVWAAPLRSVCWIFLAIIWKNARLLQLLVWITPNPNPNTKPNPNPNLNRNPTLILTLTETLSLTQTLILTLT